MAPLTPVEKKMEVGRSRQKKTTKIQSGRIHKKPRAVLPVPLLIRNQQSNLSEASQSSESPQSGRLARSRTLTESPDLSDQEELSQTGQITDVPIAFLETKKSKLD